MRCVGVRGGRSVWRWCSVAPPRRRRPSRRACPNGGRRTSAPSSTNCAASCRCPTWPATTPTCARTPTTCRRSSRKRGFKVETVGGPGSPVVFAQLDAPGRRGHAHLLHPLRRPAGRRRRSGPAASRSRRACSAPPGRWPTTAARTTFDPEWRLYGRSTSDDKGPIVALLNAVDALKATGGGPTWNVRVVLDGEEEAGSANFRRFAEARPNALKTDLAVTLDGPRHPSGRPDGVLRRARRRGRDPHRLRRQRRPALGQLRQLGARSVDAARQAAGDA